MTDIQTMLKAFEDVASNPHAQLQKHLEAGRRVIGVGPYYAPEELVHAAGAVPFGVWGCMGPVNEARRYFPPFYCSLCQTTLEMGLTGMLDGLSGYMTTALCDTQRAASQNWRAGVGNDIPLIFVSHPQNRKTAWGRDYAIESYAQVAHEVEECAHGIIDDENLGAAIALYNEWRAAMRSFVQLAGAHPAQVGVQARHAVIKAGYFMDKAEHLSVVRELNAALEALPESTAGYKRVVLSGIFENIPAITAMLDEMGYAVVADDLAKESRAFALCVPEDEPPLRALADAWCALDADPLLYDPEKLHPQKVVQLAIDAQAQGVVLLLAKFCDPEEFDAPLVKAACMEAGVPFLQIEVDQSTETYEQARTQLETFADILAA
ncbi:MAG TPA: 2-hydroxyacyl-CoA dehydratase [Eggerthellaceae bacterium]|nr:2-hydroxyacyl-CoA dehydratase [Eggerthellaceae bacterium]